MTPDQLEYLNLAKQADEMSARGLDATAEYEELCDRMDRPWYAMTYPQKEEVVEEIVRWRDAEALEPQS